MSTRLAVIVTYRNCEPRWLAQCLESIQGQGFEDYECFLMDDASILKALVAPQDERFKLIRQDLRRGATYQVLQASATTQAPITTWIGGDDFYPYPHCLRMIIEAHDRGSRMTYGSMIAVNEDSDYKGLIVPMLPVFGSLTWIYCSPLSWRTEDLLRAAREHPLAFTDQDGEHYKTACDVAIVLALRSYGLPIERLMAPLYAWRSHAMNDQRRDRANQLRAHARIEAYWRAQMLCVS